MTIEFMETSFCPKNSGIKGVHMRYDQNSSRDCDSTLYRVLPFLSLLRQTRCVIER